MYQVLARTFRPQRFDELVGQKHVSQTLTNAITAERLAHAYIFAGLRGTGKTTVARILAKCLNCESGPTVTPCGECAACQEIAESRAMDVLEVDAASRTKVEQTRELLEVVSFAPVRDRYKILIIDEAHMLSKASFNALLKTLEEPPPNVMFILATTEMQKVIPTILSRCQIFEFRRVGVRELTAHLRRVCDTQKIQISDPALERVARAGEGSVRDSLSVLERVLAFCGDEVDDDDVLRMLGGVRAEVLMAMVRAIAARDAGTMLTVLDGLVDEGHDLLHFWNELLAAVRDLMLMRAVPQSEAMIARSPEEAAGLTEAAESLSLDDLSRLFQILADLEPGLKSSARPRYLFEAMLIRMAALGAVRPIEQVLEALGGAQPADSGPGPQKKKRPPSARALKTRPAADPPATAPADLAEPADPAEPAETAGPVDSVETAEAPSDLRSRLAASVLEAKPMLGTILEQSDSVRLSDDDLLLCYPAGMQSLARPLERPENLALLAQHAERLAGRRVRVRVEIGSGGPAAEEVAAADPQPEAPRSRRPRRKRDAPEPSGQAGLLEKARQEPGVGKLLRDFGAQVVEIQPLEVPRDTPDDGTDGGPVEEPR